MENPGQALRRRRIGARLRQLRKSAGKSMQDAADYLDCSIAKISRIETGVLLVRISDVRNLLDLYSVTDAERDEMLARVRQSRQRGWWQDYSNVLSDAAGTLLGLQDAASSIIEYQPYLLPDLLETADYTHAVLTVRADLNTARVEQVIKMRAAHQHAIFDRSPPPNMHFFIDEGVLHRQAGGTTVMHAQIKHIIDLTTRKHITVQIVPFSAGPLPTQGVPFGLLDFPDPADPPLVYAEHLSDCQSESKPAIVDRYTHLVRDLRNVALTPAESIDDLARRWSSGLA